MKTIFITLAIVFTLFTPHGARGDEQVRTEINSLISRYNKAYVAQNISKLLNLHHPESYGYKTMKEQGDYFDKYDTKAKLHLLAFIGFDDDVATTRVKWVVTSHSERTPEVHTVDTVMVFRKHENKWLFWDKVYLDFSNNKKQANQELERTVKTPAD